MKVFNKKTIEIRIIPIILVVIILVTLLPTGIITVSAARAESGTCKYNLEWELDDEGTLTITGPGYMDIQYEWGYNPPWGSNGIKNVIISAGIKNISDHAFIGCSDLRSVVIPSSVTSIGDYAFSGCTSLTSVIIPDSVKSIGIGAFNNTGYYNNSSNWRVNALYIGKWLIGAKTDISGVYSIRDDTVGIAGGVFSGCTRLAGVTIPDSVTSIGGYAFNKCTGLTSVTIPDSVTSIGGSAFSSCTGLTSVKISDSVTDISYAFQNCTGLTSITIPDSVTSIGSSAFQGCTGLTSVTIPDSVTSIGSSAFQECTGLASITIPNSVTSIEYYAFSGCSKLNSIVIPDGVKSICSEAFENTGYYNNSSNWENNALYLGKWLIKAKTNISGTYSIKEGTVGIAGKAFMDQTRLTSITIPDSVTYIENCAFYGCTGMTSINIPDSVTSIGGQAFYGCSKLKSIVIPDSVKSIGYEAFENTGYYNNSSNWENNALYLGKWLLKAKTGISGVYSIKDGTVEIADGAFFDCAGMTSITIPDSVTSIGGDAFYSCTGLTSVTIPDSVTSIGSGAFSRCTGLTSVTIPDSVTSIGSGAFMFCTRLTDITIPDSVTSIVGYAFWACYALTSVVIPDSVNSIGNNAFSHCYSLANITIPASVKSIGYDNFQHSPIILHIKEGSYAHNYAISNNLPCVVEGHLLRISIGRVPAKIYYLIEKDALNLSGGEINLYYDDGSHGAIDMALSNVSGFDNTKLGTQTLVVDYMGKTTTFDVEIVDKKLSRIAVTALPTKNKYIEGKERLDVAGGKITRFYDNGTTDIIDLTAEMVSGFNNTIVGIQTLTVTYQEQTATFDVEIVAKTLAEIAVTTLPEKMSYLEGKDTLSVNGGKVTLYYNNDTSEVIDLTADMVSGFDNSKVGSQTLTVTYKGKTATFDVTIVAKSLTGIAVTAVPDKFSYLEGKDALDVSGGKVSLYYDNGAFDVIDMTLPMVSGFDNTKVGSQTLKVEYQGFTATFSITIVAKQVSQIAISALPNKLRYLINKDEFDITGGILKLYYDNDTTRDAYMVYNNGYKLMFADDFTLADLSVTGFDNTEVGTKTIVVRYGGKSTTFNVEILDKTLIRFEMTTKPAKTEYIKGEQLDLSGVAIKLYYDNGEVQTASVISVMGNHRMIISGSSSSEEIVVDGFFGNNSGRQTVTLTYNGCSDSFVVKVRGENVIYGDPDGDGEITVTDALFSMRAILGIVIIVDGDAFIAADVDDDGLLTVSDALRMLRMAAGLPVTRFSI